MKLGWADWATDGKNQDGSRVGVATVAAMVWPFPVWVCNGNRWQSEAWWQREAWAAARVFFFIVFVSPLFSFHFFPSFLVFLHFRFSLVPFVPFARFSFFHFFFLFTIFLLDLHGLMGSWLGCRLGYGGQVILIKGTQVLFSFFLEKFYLLIFFFWNRGGPGPLKPSPGSIPACGDHTYLLWLDWEIFV